MLEGGFILLHRSILRWEWYGDLNTARLFIHLLLTVNYEPQRWQGIAVERGQRVASLAKLADETGLTVKQVRTALEHLKRTGEVTHKATSKYGLFTGPRIPATIICTASTSARPARALSRT